MLASDLFAGTRPSSSSERVQIPREPRDARRRLLDQQWTPNDDMLLKALVEKYPQNWALVADSFNSSRVTISVDHRIPWDCYERWNARWGSGSTLTKDVSEMTSQASVERGASSPTPARDQMTTRGVKRLASVSIGSHASPGGSGNEPKKRRRHNLMFDAIRKAAKKREQNQKANGKMHVSSSFVSTKEQFPAAQKKPAAVHDTHGPFAKMPRYTPSELSRIKADREQKEHDQIAFNRQNQLLRQGNRMQGVPTVSSMDVVQVPG